MRVLRGRWFQFRLRTLLILTAAVAVGCAFWFYGDQQRIQGVWKGTGRAEGYTMIFHGNTLLGEIHTTPPTAPMVSRFELQEKSRHIDIVRDDGVQLGLYELNGDSLTLSLGKVGGLRPGSLHDDRVAGQQRFEFKRLPK